MGTLQFILTAGAIVVGIVWAIDIPTTKWEFKHEPLRRKRTLLEILMQAQAIQQTGDGVDYETRPPARTYTEAVKRMQEREKARLEHPPNNGDSSRVQG